MTLHNDIDDQTLHNARRLFRNRFERYAVDRSATTGADLDGSSLTLVELCDILAEDGEEVPPYVGRMLSRRFTKELLDKLPEPVRYGDLAKLILIQHKYQNARR